MDYTDRDIRCPQKGHWGLVGCDVESREYGTVNDAFI